MGPIFIVGGSCFTVVECSDCISFEAHSTNIAGPSALARSKLNSKKQAAGGGFLGLLSQSRRAKLSDGLCASELRLIQIPADNFLLYIGRITFFLLCRKPLLGLENQAGCEIGMYVLQNFLLMSQSLERK